MYAGGETADQAVRMTLQGIEVAASIALKAGDTASRSLAATLYAILTDKKKVKGKTRLNTLLKSGKELKVFAIRHDDLKTFCEEAKNYGVLYCVLKEKNNTSGICDIMVRAEDASKISRIMDKFELANIDPKLLLESIKEYVPVDVPTLTNEEHDELISSLMDDEKKSQARTQKETQFEHILTNSNSEKVNSSDKRPSVRKELNEIKEKHSKQQKSITKNRYIHKKKVKTRCK